LLPRLCKEEVCPREKPVPSVEVQVKEEKTSKSLKYKAKLLCVVGKKY
jgi:hypothetical protein